MEATFLDLTFSASSYFAFLWATARSSGPHFLTGFVSCQVLGHSKIENHDRRSTLYGATTYHKQTHHGRRPRGSKVRPGQKYEYIHIQSKEPPPPTSPGLNIEKNFELE